jgi:hypothetical protein
MENYNLLEFPRKKTSRKSSPELVMFFTLKGLEFTNDRVFYE